MLKASQGHIVNIVGGAGALAGARVHHRQLGQRRAGELRRRDCRKLGMRDGVNVNVIHPGNTRTERQEELLQQRAQATGKPVEEIARRRARHAPASAAIGEVEDVAALALFLCSEAAPATSRAPRSRSMAEPAVGDRPAGEGRAVLRRVFAETLCCA